MTSRGIVVIIETSSKYQKRITDLNKFARVFPPQVIVVMNINSTKAWVNPAYINPISIDITWLRGYVID